MILKTMSYFNIEIDRVDLSLRSDEKNKYFDDEEIWETSQTMLRNILKKFNYKTKLPKEEIERRGNVIKHTNLDFLRRWLKSEYDSYEIEKLEVEGEAAFYGPKIDYQYSIQLQ